MEMSQEIAALAEAMAKAQAEIKGAVKDASNPFYKSTYASLESVREACVGPLSKHGIAVFQSPSTDGSKVSIDTLLAHTSGQWVKGTMSAHAKDDSPQSIGSAVSYLRRYALQSFAGVAPEDDDGEAATERTDRAPESVLGEQLRASIAASAKPPLTAKDVPPGLRVTNAKIAKEGTNAKGPWTLYMVKFSDGNEYSTFSKSIYNAAHDAGMDGRLVERQVDGKNLIALEPVFQHGNDPRTLDADKVPF